MISSFFLSNIFDLICKDFMISLRETDQQDSSAYSLHMNLFQIFSLFYRLPSSKIKFIFHCLFSQATRSLSLIRPHISTLLLFVPVPVCMLKKSFILFY